MRTADGCRVALGEKLIGEGVMGAGRVKAGLVGVLVGAHSCTMRNRQVIAFHEILGETFPVGVPQMVFGKNGDVIFLPVIRHDRRQLGQRISDWHRRFTQRQINPSLINLAAYWPQSKRRFLKTIRPVHEGGADKPAVKIIGPGVIGTGKAARVAAPVYKAHHPVAADIRAGRDLAVRTTHHNHRLAAMLKGHIIADIRQLVSPART